LQSSEILSVFKKAKELGFNTCLDTNGSILNESTKKLLEYTDLVLLDVKHIDNKKHKILTGVSNKQTLKTAEYLEKNNIKMWLRYVLVPEFSDDISDIKKWCEYFINYKNIEKVEILPYHTLGEHKYEELGWEYKLKNIKPPTPEKILEVEKIFKKYFKKVVIR